MRPLLLLLSAGGASAQWGLGANVGYHAQPFRNVLLPWEPLTEAPTTANPVDALLGELRESSTRNEQRARTATLVARMAAVRLARTRATAQSLNATLTNLIGAARPRLAPVGESAAANFPSANAALPASRSCRAASSRRPSRPRAKPFHALLFAPRRAALSFRPESAASSTLNTRRAVVGFATGRRKTIRSTVSAGGIAPSTSQTRRSDVHSSLPTATIWSPRRSAPLSDAGLKLSMQMTTLFGSSVRPASESAPRPRRAPPR